MEGAPFSRRGTEDNAVPVLTEGTEAAEEIPASVERNEKEDMPTLARGTKDEEVPTLLKEEKVEKTGRERRGGAGRSWRALDLDKDLPNCRLEERIGEFP